MKYLIIVSSILLLTACSLCDSIFDLDSVDGTEQFQSGKSNDELTKVVKISRQRIKEKRESIK